MAFFQSGDGGAGDTSGGFGGGGFGSFGGPAVPAPPAPGSASQSSSNPNKDIEVKSPPPDSVSQICFSKDNILAASSWDSAVRCWRVRHDMSTEPLSVMKHDAPVMSCDWHSDGQSVFSGACDKTAKMWHIQTGEMKQVAAHDAPIRCVKWVEDANSLATGSWDKTVKLWDIRQQKENATVQLYERCYAMDIVFPLMIVATAERHVLIFDIRQPTKAFREMMSPLKFQSRCVACFPDRSGFALGSIEGRVAIHHVDDKDRKKNFAFKCHRHQNKIYPVNCLSFHRKYGTFSTAGADGGFNFWDKDAKQRLSRFERLKAPITWTCFNSDQTIFAYASSYDWSKGAQFYKKDQGSQIFLHLLTDGEIKTRPAQT